MPSIRGTLKRATAKPVLSTFNMSELFRQHDDLKGLKDHAASSFEAIMAELRSVIGDYKAMHVSHDEAMQARLSILDSSIEEVVKVAMEHIKSIKPDPIDEKAIVERIHGMIRQPEDGKSIDQEEVVRSIVARLPEPDKIDHKKLAKEVVKLMPVQALPTIEEILAEIKKNLKVEHIPGLKNEIASYRSQLAGKQYGKDTWARGGGDIVSAGTNVTVTRVNGQAVISSSGGSGFTTIDATESPDGNLVVFTFPLASAKPTYIVADGVWTKATNKAGTVTNWTWSAGTKKATMNVAPLSDIYAVA